MLQMMARHMIDRRPGARLAEVRKSRGMKQRELAQAIGVSTATIQSYERGRAVLNMRRLDQIADALECDPTELFPRRRAV